MKNRFRKYYPKLFREGMIRAALFGLTVGFGVNFVVAIVAWCVGYHNLWLPIGIGLGVAIAVSVVSFIFWYKPKLSDMARRVDELGLEERAITMLELEKDDSCIAQLQRGDTLRAMESVSAKRLKIYLSRVVVILAIVFAVLGTSATTLVGLASDGVIPGGSELLEPEPVYYIVSYMVYDEEGGEILGETDQLVLAGEDAEPVTAVAFDGYVFKEWIDTSTEPTRQELNVTTNFEVYAFFTSIDGAETGEGEGEPSEQPEEEGDEDENAPDDEQESDEPGDENEESSDESGGGGNENEEAGGRWDDKNTIIDGSQYYYDNIDTYRELAMEFLASNPDIPDYVREFLETYYDGLS